MHSSSSLRFGSPKEELPSTERTRQTAKRESRLEQHTLYTRNEPSPNSRPANQTTRSSVSVDLRDPAELHRGLDVQILSDSAYDRLFQNEDGAGS